MSGAHDAPRALYRYQKLLVAALTARIAAVEQHVGARYSFEIRRAHPTTTILAHTWPHAEAGVPFNRAFDYVASLAAEQQSVNADELTRDIVLEVLPRARATATERYLETHGCTPRWRIPWMHIALDQPMAQPLLAVRQIAPNEREAFATLLVAGYGYQGAQAAAWHDLARYGYGAPGFTCFIAGDPQPIAAGVVYVRDGIALVDGAATLPEQRGRGAQTALLSARLAFARAQGCTHAVSRTSDGSISQRNMERLGMRAVAYSTAWMR